MSKMNSIEKIEKLVTPSLLKCTFFNNDDGSYTLFEEYIITKNNDTITVYRYRDEKIYTFNKIKHAVVWAILDKHNKFYEASRVLELDLKLESVNVDKLIHRRLKKSKNHDFLLYSVKYEQDVERQNKFQHEIDKYIMTAKICQEQGFQNELNRSSRKQKEQVSY